MSIKKHNNESLLLKLKVEELGINTLLNSYHNIQEEYIRNLNGGFRSQAQTNLAQMGQINNKLKSILATAQGDLNQIHKKNIIDQQKISINSPQLLELTERLNSNEKKIMVARSEFGNINNNGASSALSRRSNYFTYIVMLILAVISNFLTIKAFSNEESSTVENVILVLAIGLIAYHIIEKLYGNVTRT